MFATIRAILDVLNILVKDSPVEDLVRAEIMYEVSLCNVDFSINICLWI